MTSVLWRRASIMRRFVDTPTPSYTPPIPAASSCQSPCRGITAPTLTSQIRQVPLFTSGGFGLGLVSSVLGLGLGILVLVLVFGLVYTTVRDTLQQRAERI